MVDAATGLPSAPAPFVETGTDPLSLAISGMLPGIEDPIQEALPKLKTEATKTANNIVTAAGRYQRTDEQLAANYDEHRFDGANSAGAGSAGSGGGGNAMGSMGQLMSMPMQVAGKAAQIPMQAMGAVASVPQSVMQGVQQVGSMAGGAGGPEQPRDGQDDGDRQDPREGAEAGRTDGERAPVSTEAVVPQQNSGRHAAPDPSVDL
jgi:hypothetical protein